MHKAGGTTICALAKRNGLKAPRRNCNMDGDGPRTLHFTAHGEGNANMSCAARSAAYRAGHYSFAAVERWLDVPLCPSTFSYGTALREPIARAVSNARFHGIADTQVLGFLAATTLPTDQSRAGPEPSTGPEKIFYGTAAVDNFYVRTLGGREAFHRPAGALTRRDLDAAKAVLEEFDVVVVLEDGERGWRELGTQWGWQHTPQAGERCAGGRCSRVPAAAGGGGGHGSRTEKPASPSLAPATVAALTAANALDLELYEWARERQGRGR